MTSRVVIRIVAFIIIVCSLLSDIADGGNERKYTHKHRENWRPTYNKDRTTTKEAILAGVYYGSRAYILRRRYKKGDYKVEVLSNSDPTVCENFQTSDKNGTIYGLFICPMGDHPEDYTYCCGDDGNERCCKWADAPGRIIAMVFPVIIVLSVIAVTVLVCRKLSGKWTFFFGKCRRGVNKEEPATESTHTQEMAAMTSNNTQCIRRTNSNTNSAAYPVKLAGGVTALYTNPLSTDNVAEELQALPPPPSYNAAVYGDSK